MMARDKRPEAVSVYSPAFMDDLVTLDRSAGNGFWVMSKGASFCSHIRLQPEDARKLRDWLNEYLEEGGDEGV